LSKLKSALVLLVLVILLEGSTLLSPPLHVPLGGQRIALDVKPPVILEHGLAPSFADLTSLGFTDIGTDLDPGTPYNLTAQFVLRNWLRSAHMAGLRVFASIGSNSSLNQRIQTAVALGFDYVELDEFLSGHVLTRQDFQSLLIGITKAYSIPVLVTEYDRSAFQIAVLFAQQHPGITVASDEYQQMSSLVDVSRIGQLSMVGVAAWIIFIPDSSHQWDAYVNLQSWTVQALTLGLSVYFYAVQNDGGWMGKWPMLQNLLRTRQFSLSLLATKRTTVAILLALSVWPAYSLIRQIIKPGKRAKRRITSKDVRMLRKMHGLSEKSGSPSTSV
jgi:hypothetical protein